jgi:hypothetical protein
MTAAPLRIRPAKRRPRGVRLLLAVLVAAPLLAGVAFAAPGVVGLLNPSFELDANADRLPDEWTARVAPADGGTPAPATCPNPPGQRAICVVGTDSFTPDGGSLVTVQPLDGGKMVRLGGPFLNDDQSQNRERFLLEQTFVVDPANPVLALNYNAFLFDYTGFDELHFTVRLGDANGAVLADLVQGGFGSGTSLKTTGWRSAAIDLSSYANQQVHLRIDSGGTHDELYGFWAYVDAGFVPTPPVGVPTVGLPPGVDVDVETDPLSGQTWFTIPNSQASLCTELTINVPINPGGGVVSNVTLLQNGTAIPMTDPEGDGVWTATVICEASDLAVQYTLTEGGSSETFVVPVGGIALIDPQGVVYELARYQAAIAAGKSPEQARAETAISGATVELQRQGADGVFRKVLSGDPGITPNVNPQTTGANGRYQWDVSAGVYRVVVRKAGFDTVTSREVTIPPPVLDLHVALGPPLPPPPPPAAPPPPPPPPPAPVRRPAVARCVVPNVKGKTVAQARKALVKKRCKLGRVTRAYSRKVKKGRIIGQSKRPGARLPRGTKVGVKLSRGRRR